VDTTIKVDSLVRDRLARIAAERGTSIRELVAQLADSMSTEEELATRALAATRYVRDRINPDLSESDLVAAEAFWTAIEAGRLPEISALYPARGGTEAA
jgi:predicted DNA-binding ribbon-helix-helix protein